MAEDNKSMFVLISIVAIVAVVGLVVLIMGGGKAHYKSVAQPATYEAGIVEVVPEDAIIDKDVDSGGRGYSETPRRECKDYDNGVDIYSASYTYGDNPLGIIGRFYDYCSKEANGITFVSSAYYSNGEMSNYLVEHRCNKVGFVVSEVIDCTRYGRERICQNGACW